MTEKNNIKTSSPDFLCVVTSGTLSFKSSHLDEIKLIREGIKAEGVLELAKSLNWSIDYTAKALGTTSRTLRFFKNKSLNQKLSENAIEIARLSSFGIEYFNSIEAWGEWLNRPSFHFNALPPYCFLQSIRGRYLIKYIIQKLRFGFTA